MHTVLPVILPRTSRVAAGACDDHRDRIGCCFSPLKQARHRAPGGDRTTLSAMAVGNPAVIGR